LPKAEWTEDALDDLNRLDRQVAKRILKKVTWLSRHFDNIVPEPLTGSFSGLYKLRVGDWRVFYTIESDTLVIRAVGHRREACEI
jgi:mRNA interferase RelE/StbE